ncbi:MAG: Clp protease ClpP [Cypionkella sp.]|nr:Clp protease ClpP [Cypionkella sp.]
MNPMVKMRLANKGRGDFKAEGNVLWLYDAIASDDDESAWFGGVSPRQFIAALASIEGPVTLRINSPGGSVFGAQAMVAAMRAHGAPITAQIDSLAASAASVIAAECAECVMSPGSMLMIHKAWGMTIGNADDHAQVAGLLSKIDNQIAATYARRAADDDVEKYMGMMAAETWFDADEAVAANLADRVLAENSQRPAAKWDLSAYASAPWQPAQIEQSQPDPEPASLQNELRQARQRRVAARLVREPI